MWQHNQRTVAATVATAQHRVQMVPPGLPNNLPTQEVPRAAAYRHRCAQQLWNTPAGFALKAQPWEPLCHAPMHTSNDDVINSQGCSACSCKKGNATLGYCLGPGLLLNAIVAGHPCPAYCTKEFRHLLHHLALERSCSADWWRLQPQVQQETTKAAWACICRTTGDAAVKVTR